jgi:SAM-dependent methyltransferase
VSEIDRELRLDNPMLVRWEFASEERLATRNAIYRRLIEGDDAEELLFQAVAEARPGRVLEVGCGAGELAARIANELGAEVVALDSSERMISLTRQRGVEAVLGDVQQLPFEVAADMTRAHLAANMSPFKEPVPARSHHTVFVAEKV